MLDLDSLFKLSYGMYIVGSKHESRFNGCIVNTVFQITPEPPMMAISLNRQCLTHKYISASKIFAVSVLSQDTPMDFIGRFGFRSGRDIDKFEQINYRPGQNGAPIILDNTITFIEAEVTESIDVLTHTLFIARITACESVDNNKAPMSYAYYRDIRQGKTPEAAATYHKVESKAETQKQGAGKMQKYKCLVCGYIYDPAVGDPENGVKAGTAFEDLPADWGCPRCRAGKDEFEPA